MALVLAMAAGLWGLGWVMKVPGRTRALMLLLLYAAVLVVQVALPEGHPLREATGGSAAQWLVLGGMVALVAVYRAGLLRLRARAEGVDAAREADAPKPAATFSGEELERYARHITLREIGGPGQKKLKHAKVLVVGAGGLGSPVLIYLAAAGVGRIGVIDHDVVDLSNLQRQIIHTDGSQGMPKVFSAEQRIKALNPHVEVRPYHRELTAEIAETLFADYDLIVDGTDAWPIRDLINRAAVATGKPVVSGAISAWEGQVTIYDPAHGAPCMACVFPEPPAPGMAATCSETGVIGAMPGVVGAMMATEVIKWIAGAGEPLTGRMLIYDALYADTRLITLKRAADCAVCGAVG
ncbi:HesA/MoeB/ThiF family protein [Nioella nitratireducens]|uniref:HesA/MoeB/ThiF family protein n=1 Tax=Nioella nitratireducens TaxID=1287720 RepID=UPI0008FD706E|nr:HesA/MoeB/ThiF family protein [Nioella nitratireducens]